MAYIIRKISDEGSSDPFVARLWNGILDLRDTAIQDKLKTGEIAAARRMFDKSYSPVLDALGASRTAMRNIQRLVLDHQEKVSRGEIIRRQPNALEVSETIDSALRDNAASFLVNAVIAMKDTQKVVRQFDVNIGCLFTKEANFWKGV